MINLKSNWLLQQDFAKKKSRTWNIVLNIVTEHCSHLINLTNGYFLLANRTKKAQITFLSWEKKIQFEKFFLLRKHRNFRDDLNQNTFCHLNNWSQISANGFCFIYKKTVKCIILQHNRLNQWLAIRADSKDAPISWLQLSNMYIVLIMPTTWLRNIKWSIIWRTKRNSWLSQGMELNSLTEWRHENCFCRKL